MKLYFSPGACSLAPHIALLEGGFKFELARVDLATKKTAGGEDYLAVNPKGYVPALKFDDAQVLTEAGVILQYLADQKPESGLAPKLGTMERYRLMEWLGFISTEVHKQFGPFFHPNTPEQTKQNQKELLARRFEYLAARLTNNQFLMGEQFTIADAYLYTVLNWTGMLKIDLAPWPALQKFQARVAARPQVEEAMKAEGLVK